MGTVFTSQSDPTTSFQLQPAGGNDAILVDGSNSGTFNFATPAAYSSLTFLVSTAGGDGSDNSIMYSVNYADGAGQTGSLFNAPNWFDSGPTIAYRAQGRVDLNGNFSDINDPNGPPYLFQVSAPLLPDVGSHRIDPV